MKMRFKLLLLDSDETLIDYYKCEKGAFLYLADQLNRSQGESLDLYGSYGAVNMEAWEKYKAGALSKSALRVWRMQQVFNESSETKAVEYAEIYEAQLAREVHLIPGAEEFLKAAASVAKIVVVTNGIGAVHRERFQRSGLLKHLTGIVVSGDQDSDDFRKPNPQIFEAAHQQFAPEVSKSNVLVIGDSIDSDIVGGISYGVSTCWFNPSEGISPNVEPTFQICRWREFFDAVSTLC